jgi:hypothetical protein
MSLNKVDRVEHDHPWHHRHAVLDFLTTAGVSAPDL